MGWRGRGGGWASRWPGRGPFRDIPPWQRPGWLYGYGAGRYYSSYDPSVCQRFPWLPKWWWANPEIADDVPSYEVPKVNAEQEKRVLEKRAEFLEQEIEYINKRLEELKKEE